MSRGAPTLEQPLSPCVISTVSQRPEAIVAGGVVDMDHERGTADRSAVDPFGVRPVIHNRHRRLAGGPSRGTGFSWAGYLRVSIPPA